MQSVHSKLVVLALALALLPGAGQLRAQDAGTALDTEDKRIIYALGIAIGQNLTQFKLSESEVALVQEAIRDVALGKEPKVDLMQYGPKLQEFAKARMQVGLDAEKAEGAKFIAKMAAEEGAVTTDSGLVYKEMTPGTGASPAATDTVSVHYHGTLRDGTVFDSSVQRGTPLEFGLNRVVKCWTEGVQMMKVGGKSRLVCPSDIAYGDQGNQRIPGGAVLVFEVELLAIKSAEGE